MVSVVDIIGFPHLVPLVLQHPAGTPPITRFGDKDDNLILSEAVMNTFVVIPPISDQ